MELWRTDKMLTQVRSALGQKEKATPSAAPNESNASASMAVEQFVFRCKKCEFSSTALKMYKKHMLNEHSDTVTLPYSCERCDTGFRRLDFFKKHQDNCHGKEAQEQNSTMKPNDTKKLNGIKQKDAPVIAEDVGLFKCPECKYTHDNPKVFRRHMMASHNYAKNECFKCTLCKKIYAIAQAFKKHMEMHRNEQLGIKTKSNKHLASATLGEQTLNNAKAMSTPISAKKKDNKKQDSAAKPKNNIDLSTIKMEIKETSTPINTDGSAIKKKKKKKKQDELLEETIPNAENNTVCSTIKKKKRALEESTNGEVKLKKTKLFEKIKDETITEDVTDTYTCSQCSKTVSSQKKLQKHILKRHS